MKEQLALLPRYLTAHLQLTLLALSLAVLISLPLGVWVARSPKRETIVLGIASVVQTVPSLALLALMVPLLSWLRLPSIGYLPAAIALVLYGVLPILTNTVVALTTLDPALLEAAQAVGMTLRQQLFRVELPLALPVIVTGVRTSAVWTVGMATLSTPVGAPSLGNYIFGGLQTRNLAAVLVGSLAAAALALTLDQLMRLLLRGLKERKKGATVAASAGMALLAFFAGGALASNIVSPRRASLAIGTKNFTEQYILGEILSQSITRRTPIPIEIKSGLGSTVAFDALRTGNLDAYVDYSGTLWTTILKREGRAPDPGRMRSDIAHELRQRYGIDVVAALGFENAYALAMRRTRADELGIRRIGDLRAQAAALSIGADYEFLGRPEWKAIRAAYGLRFGTERSMDPALMYQAVLGGTVDVISAFSTDGRIPALDLVVIEDDQHAIPPYDALILTSATLARRSPEAMEALEALEGRIDQKTMQHLNRLVDEEGLTPHRAAEGFFAAVR